MLAAPSAELASAQICSARPVDPGLSFDRLSDSTLGRIAVPGLARRFTIWSLATTAACLPLYVVRWHIGPLPTTLLENLIGITVVGYAATVKIHPEDCAPKAARSNTSIAFPAA